MRAFFCSLLAAFALSATIISAAPGPQSRASALGNAQSGPADPLTLGLRAGAYRQSLYGDKSATQSPIPDQPETVVESAGCGSNCKSTLSFAGSAAKKFEVGNHIPTVGFKTRNSWAGNLPIATDRLSGLFGKEFYFWLWGAETPSDDLVLWLNGGPGCSSLYGFLQEHGVIDFSPGKKAATDASNTTSWTQLANMLYLEQPVGVGFTKGAAYVKDEDDIAAGVVGFLENFYKTFPELKSKKLWITGESYAGTYIPYIASALYKAGNKHNLQGIWIVDGLITDDTLINYVVTSDFVAKNNDEYLHLPQSAVNKINADANRCGYGTGNNSYVAKNLNYPPKGPLPAYNKDGCGTWDQFIQSSYDKNPAFNFYYIAQKKETNPPSVLGDPNDPDQGSKKTFFDNKALQAYINAPSKKWVLCNSDVLPNGDPSPPPDKKNLAYVIESAPSKRNVIANGDLDGIIMTVGVALALQNLKWNGKRGFSTSPSANKLIDTKGKVSGGYVTERGLSFAFVKKAGHEIPFKYHSIDLFLTIFFDFTNIESLLLAFPTDYTPYSGLKILSYLLGKTESLGA